MTKQDLPTYIIVALQALGGRGTIAEICKHIWDNEVSRIPIDKRTNLFYTWGYDLRWAAQKLRDDNLIHIPERGIWALGPKRNPTIN